MGWVGFVSGSEAGQLGCNSSLDRAFAVREGRGGGSELHFSVDGGRCCAERLSLNTMDCETKGFGIFLQLTGLGSLGSF